MLPQGITFPLVFKGLFLFTSIFENMGEKSNSYKQEHQIKLNPWKMWGEKIYHNFSVLFYYLYLVIIYLTDSNFKRIWKGFLLWVCVYSWQGLRQAKSPQRIYCMIDGLQTRKCSYSVVTAQTFKPYHYQLKSKKSATKSEGRMRRKKQKWEEVGILDLRVDIRTNNEVPTKSMP